MKKILAFVLLAGCIYACGDSTKENKPDTGGTPAANADGEKIYKTYCVTCHGLYGDMGASGAFNLKTSVLPLEERINTITNGRKAMTPFKELLTPEKIKAVAEYTLTLKQ
jgi:mono/diheme cytochrome c family protein